MSTPTQENQTTSVAAAVTPTEKRCINVVAAARGVSVSSLLRARSVQSIVREGQKILSQHSSLAA